MQQSILSLEKPFFYKFHQYIKFIHSELHFPIVASSLFCINAIVLLLTFDLSRVHIKSEWLYNWGIVPENPELPQIFTYWFLHFHLTHFLGVSFLLICAGAFGEQKISKKVFLCYYVLGATVFVWLSIVLLKILFFIIPSFFLLQWYNQGIDGHIVGSSAASFSVYGCIYPVITPRLRPFYIVLLISAIFAPIIIFQTVNVGDWAHLFVPIFALVLSTFIFNKKTGEKTVS